AARRSWKVHARFSPEAKDILEWRHDGIRHRGHQRADESPMDLLAVQVQVAASVVALPADALLRARALASAGAGPPANGRVAIVCTGVGNALMWIVVRAEIRSLGVIAESKLQNAHAGKTELQANGFHFGRDDAQVFGNQRQL